MFYAWKFFSNGNHTKAKNKSNSKWHRSELNCIWCIVRKQKNNTISWIIPLQKNYAFIHAIHEFIYTYSPLPDAFRKMKKKSERKFEFETEFVRLNRFELVQKSGANVENTI